MNRQMFEQMMARLGSSSMLPPPSADYAPGGSMFPGGASNASPTSDIGEKAQMAMKGMAGKGGGAG